MDTNQVLTEMSEVRQIINFNNYLFLGAAICFIVFFIISMITAKRHKWRISHLCAFIWIVSIILVFVCLFVMYNLKSQEEELYIRYRELGNPAIMTRLDLEKEYQLQAGLPWYQWYI